MPTPEFPEQLRFPELVDIAGAATLLAVNIRKVRRMVASGELPFIRLGRLLRFDRADLLAHIEACRVPKAG